MPTPVKVTMRSGGQRKGSGSRPFSTHFVGGRSTNYLAESLSSNSLLTVPADTGGGGGGGRKSPSSLRRSNSTGNKPRKMSSSAAAAAAAPSDPGVKSWVKSKSAKRVQPLGRVFGTCVDEKGGFLLAMMSERGERFVQQYDVTHAFVRQFPCKAKGGKYYEVFQIVITSKGTIAAACKTCVTVWSREGKLIMDYGRYMFKSAKFIASRSNGELIVSDTDDDSVKVISASGQPTHKIPHTFKAPTGVAVDSHDNLVVADWNDKIRVFDSDNQLIHTFGVKGSKNGEVDLPYGLTFDCEDNLILCDMWNNRVSLYNTAATRGTGEHFMRHVVGSGSLDGTGVGRPAFVSVSRTRHPNSYRLVVSDFTAGLITVFDF